MMFHPTKAIKAALIFAGFSLVLTGCAASTDSAEPIENCTPAHADLETIEPGVLTIGVGDAPPLVSTVGDDGFGGLDSEIIRDFAEAECLTIKPVHGAISAMITGVEQGRWDTALGGWYRTSDRAEIVDVSNPMYLDTLVIISEDPVSSIPELEGKRIGTHDGTIFVEDLKAVFGDNLSLYPSPLEVAQDLKAGRLDAAFGTGLEAPVSYSEGEFSIMIAEPDERVATTLSPGQTSLPFKKGTDNLQEAFNDYLDVIKDDGRLVEFLKMYDFPAEISETGEPRYL